MIRGTVQFGIPTDAASEVPFRKRGGRAEQENADKHASGAAALGPVLECVFERQHDRWGTTDDAPQADDEATGDGTKSPR
ncbi:MAG: hypothetical protein ACYS0E_21210, partial [Planctomycetota bacterium]